MHMRSPTLHSTSLKGRMHREVGRAHKREGKRRSPKKSISTGVKSSSGTPETERKEYLLRRLESSGHSCRMLLEVGTLCSSAIL